MMALDGTVALVTGASKGIGQAIAVALATAGADVGVNYNTDRPGADATCAGRRGDRTQRALPLHADVSERAAVEGMVQELQAHFGRLDILVNNAAIGIGHQGSFADYPLDAWRRVFAVNLDGVVHCTQAALKTMLAQQPNGRLQQSDGRIQQMGGRIVNISSSHSLVFQRRTTAYTVAKGAAQHVDASAGGRVRPARDHGKLHCRRRGLNTGVACLAAGRGGVDSPRPPRAHGTGGGYCRCRRIPRLAAG